MGVYKYWVRCTHCNGRGSQEGIGYMRKLCEFCGGNGYTMKKESVDIEIPVERLDGTREIKKYNRLQSKLARLKKPADPQLADAKSIENKDDQVE